MTRDEQIINSAKEHEHKIGFCDLVKSPAARGINSAYGIGFIDGAVWADSTMIDKACEWLKDNVNDSYLDWYDWEKCRLNKDELLHDFREAMEE